MDTVFEIGFAWRLNHFDKTFNKAFHRDHQRHQATSIRKHTVVCNVQIHNELEKKIKTLLWCVNSSAFLSSGNANARMTRILDHFENFSTWKKCSNVMFACILQCFIVKWNKTLIKLLNNLLVPVGSAFLYFLAEGFATSFVFKTGCIW